MKNTLVLLLFPLAVLSQDFKSELVGKMVPAKMKFGDGKEMDILMKYHTFEYNKFPQNKHFISITGSEADAYEHTGGIESFLIDGNTWALRPVPGTSSNQFVIMRRQGAIEQYEAVKYGQPNDKEDQVYAAIGSRTMLITHKVGTNDFVQGPLTMEKLKLWIVDAPDVVEDLKLAEAAAVAEQKRQDSIKANGNSSGVKSKGLMGALEKAGNKMQQANDKQAAEVDMGRIINNYNASYERRNPGQISYQFATPPSWIPLPAREKSAEERKAERDKLLNAVFANRKDKVAPEFASAKENTPVKKETFTGKLQRIKTDGNKIGVLFAFNPVTVNPPENNTVTTYSASLADNANVQGTYRDETLIKAGQSFVEELNKTFNTTEFELIDIANIPYREVKVMGTQVKIDDWWATKYKVVFAYSLDPRLRTSNEDVGGKLKFAAALNLVAALVVTEYIGDTSSNKRDIPAQILNMGSFTSPTYMQDDDMTDVKAIYEKTIEKLGVPLINKIQSERAGEMPKLVKRLGP